MIKIGIECESIEDRQTWGVGRIINKLLEELSKRPELGNEFKFFLYFKSKIPDHPYLASPLFVKKIIRVPFLPPSFSLYYYVFLPIKLYFEGLNVMFFPNYMLPIIFKGRSIVTLTEDIYYEFKSGNLPLRYKLAYRIFGQWAAGHATKIMAMSESSKKAMADLFKINAAKISVNQLGIDIRKPHSQNMNYEINNYILYVGQAFPRRHLKETILAFEKISSQFPDLKLIAVGKDKYNPPIISDLISQVNQRLERTAIIQKDYVSEEELADLYKNARSLVYVSSKEAFGLPPIEALAFNTVSVVSRNDVTKEIFGSEGNESAFFVDDPNSVDSITDTITASLNNQQKRQQIVNSASNITAKYTWSAYTDRFIKIVKEIPNV